MTDGLFYYTPEADPYFNMAFDTWLFEAFAESVQPAPALLRLYSWSRPAVTIGYNQRADEVVDIAGLPENTPVIRRITGGRAIYHDESEITFSLAAELSALPTAARSLSGANALVSETIVDILRGVGVEAVWARHSDDGFRKQAGKRVRSCFDSVSRYEIVAGGQKVVGIAQRRRGDCLIQQGSIKINGVTANPAVRQAGRAVPVAVRPLTDAEAGLTAEAVRGVFREAFVGRLEIDFQERGMTSEVRQKLAFVEQNLIEFPLRKREFV